MLKMFWIAAGLHPILKKRFIKYGWTLYGKNKIHFIKKTVEFT